VSNQRRVAWIGAACLLVIPALTIGAAQRADDKKDKDQDKRPKINLTARPIISVSPSRVSLTAELQGGPNDSEEYYCPTIEWDWGDGTMSESSNDCEPYEAGKSQIRRRYTVQHLFRAGTYRITFRIKKRDKVLSAATTNIEVRPGVREFE
jgi:hypothetical protein